MAYTTYSLYLEAQVEFGLTVLGLGRGCPLHVCFILLNFVLLKANSKISSASISDDGKSSTSQTNFSVFWFQLKFRVQFLAI